MTSPRSEQWEGDDGSDSHCSSEAGISLVSRYRACCLRCHREFDVAKNVETCGRCYTGCASLVEHVKEVANEQ